MIDVTESIRRELVEEINSNPNPRTLLETQYGQVWDTSELIKDFEVEGFMAPFVVVVKRDIKQKGTLTFQHDPRFYFDFKSLD